MSYVISGHTACFGSSVYVHDRAWQQPTPPPKDAFVAARFVAGALRPWHSTPTKPRSTSDCMCFSWGWLGMRYVYHWSSREKWWKHGVTRGFRWFKPPVGGKKQKNTSTKLAWALKLTQLRLWPTHYPGAPDTKLPGWSAVETDWNTWRYLEMWNILQHTCLKRDDLCF